MNLLTIDRIRKYALISFVALGVAAALLLVHIKLSLDTIEQELSDKTNRRNQLIIEINNMKDGINRYKREIEDIQPYLFADRDVPAFLDSISQFAQQNDVTVLDMKTQKFQEVVLPKEMEGSVSTLQERVINKFGKQDQPEYSSQEIMTFAAMPIQIKIQGSFEALVDFLYALEGYQQLMTLSNVKIDVTKEYPALECAFLLRIYSMKTLEELESI